MHLFRAPFLCCLFAAALAPSAATPAAFNCAPLAAKPYAELPLGTIEPRGWLRDELQRMAAGMTGHLDVWYPEVAGPRNAWLGGDGDTWERGPYWIDGLYPLARLLQDEALIAKAMPWIEWTLNHQVFILDRTWKNGDVVELRLPMSVRTVSGYARSLSVHRGPLLFALDLPSQAHEVERPRPAGVPATAPHRGYLEFLPTAPWNYAFAAKNAPLKFELKDNATPLAANPWSRTTTPVELRGAGTPLAEWTLLRNSAAPPPLSPVSPRPEVLTVPIRLIPYGATTLRIAAFPWIGAGRR